MLTSLPNLLTLSRIIAIPVIVGLMFIASGWAAWSALVLYTLACVTDWLDGYLARAQNLVSPVGKFLDPIADKLLVGALLLVMAGTDRLNFWILPAAIIILLREILVSGLREFLAGLNQISVPVSRLAKWKTAVQMVAIGFLIVGPWGPGPWPWIEIGGVGLWVAALFTVVTGWEYMVIGWRHMNEDGSAKQDAEKPVH